MPATEASALNSLRRKRYGELSDEQRPIIMREKERSRLGLQPGVGYTEAEIGRAKFADTLRRALQLEVLAAEGTMSTSARIGFDGHPQHYETVERDPDPQADDAGPLTINTTAPLEAAFFACRRPLETYAYLAGVAVRYDFLVARAPSSGVAKTMPPWRNTPSAGGLTKAW